MLFTSGYTENAIVHHGRLDPGVILLSKPYQRKDLVNKLRQVLIKVVANAEPKGQGARGEVMSAFVRTGKPVGVQA